MLPTPSRAFTTPKKLHDGLSTRIPVKGDLGLQFPQGNIRGIKNSFGR
jgi:hypothetical protein